MIKVIMWGTGATAKQYINKYHKRMCDYVEIMAFIDNDEAKQKKRFYGYNVISYEKVDDYEFDYIVIMNTYTKEIWKQIGKEIENDRIVISSDQFFELFVNTGYWEDKRVLFYGDGMRFDLVEYRAQFTFKTVQYVKTGGLGSVTDFDVVFLCPPRLLDQHGTLTYEEKLRIDIHEKMDIEDEHILGIGEWRYYLQCDRRIKGGSQNGNKNFFIIGALDPMQGWGNILLRVLGGITYARNHHMIPIVDMQSIKNQYLPEGLVGVHNAWEDFFEQVSRFDISEVYCSRNIILSGINTHIDCLMDAGDIDYRKNVVQLLERAYKVLFPEKEKVLGVVYRGTDYNVVYSHTTPWKLTEYISYIRHYNEKIGYGYIFLATEVEEAVVAFKKEFGNKVFWVEQQRYPASERRWLYSIHFDRENDEFKKGMEYITVLELLSRCDAIVGTNSGTVRAAIVLNKNQYEHINILE